MKILIDAKGFYDYDQRETGGITEEEFEEMDIGGYSKQPSPLPKEHPNSARSSSSARQEESAAQRQPQEPASQKSDATKASTATDDEKKPSMSSLSDLPSLL